MGRSTWIILENKNNKELTLHDIVDILEGYIQNLKYTGQQLNWDYAAAAFPYTIKCMESGKMEYLQLTSTQPERYMGMLMGIEKFNDNKSIRVTLPKNATHGDRGKAQEFAKYLAKKLKAPLVQRNERIIPS